MNRRGFVKSVSIGGLTAIAGCAGFGRRAEDRIETREITELEITPGKEPTSLQFEGSINAADVSRERPARISFAVKNIGDEELRITSGAPAPLGILYGHEVKKDVSNVIWSERYEENKNVKTDDGYITWATDAAEVINLEPGSKIKREYLLQPAVWGPQPEGGEGQSFKVLNQDEQKVQLNGVTYEIEMTVV